MFVSLGCVMSLCPPSLSLSLSRALLLEEWQRRAGPAGATLQALVEVACAVEDQPLTEAIRQVLAKQEK